MEYLSATNDNQFQNAMKLSVSTPGSQPAVKPFGEKGKTCFLVYQRNKYLMIPTDTIALFYIKYTCPLIVCFNKQEYTVNYSLDQLQQMLPELQFYRLNRQYLVNVNAIQEVEHYFARKLLVKLIIPVAEKLLVSKEKATSFLQWLENR